MQASPHLHFKGNCREAFNFYAETFGGRIAFAMTYGGDPRAAAQTPPEARDQIIHARLEFGNHAVMGCDAPGERYQKPQGFNVLATVQELPGGRAGLHGPRPGRPVVMPFGPTFWAHGFGMCTDRFGVPWMVNCEKSLAT